MTNNSPLEEHIKEKFRDYSADVPPHIWENILAAKERRKPVGFWFNFLNKNLLLAFISLVIAGTGIILYKNMDPIENKKTTTANEQAELNTAKKDVNHSTKTIIKSGNDISNEHTVMPENGNRKISSTDLHNLNSVKVITAKNGSLESEKGQLAHNRKFVKSAATNVISGESDENNITKAGKTKKQKYLQGSSAMTVENPISFEDENTIDPASKEFLLQRLLLYPDLIRFEKVNISTITKINNPRLNIPCPEAEKNAAGNKRYVEVYGGPDYAFRSITDTGNSAYLIKRKESSSFSSAFSAGLRYTRVFGNGMSFRTGINYSQINEKFKLAQGNIIQQVYIINNNGDTTGSYTTTGTRYKTTHNKFRTLDVPIMVGYELGNGRIHANFNAGVIVNVYSWQKGDVLDTAYQPVNITTGKGTSPYQFKTNVGIGFMGAISVYYKLTDKWHLFAEPYFRYNFSPASKADLTLKQKYNTAGLRLGLRIDF